MVLQNAFADLATDESIQQLLTTLLPRFVANTKTYARTITASDMIEPPPGEKIRLLWVAFAPDPDEALSPTTIQFAGAAEPLYVNYALAHWQIFEGATDQSLEILLGSTVPVSVTVHYQTIP